MTSKAQRRHAGSAVELDELARSRRAKLLRLRIMLAAFWVLLAVGVGTMLYPAVNRLVFAYRSVRQIDEYRLAVEGTPVELLDQEWALARAYNEARTWNELHDENTIVDPFSEDEQTKALNEEYARLLNPMHNGVMGYIEIPRIGEMLNVYHGTDEDALLRGVGHLQGTSLPVGGTSTHCLLSAHRGMATAKLFTDLDQLKRGDQFYLHVLNHHMAYEVDNIQTVKPTDIGSLDIVRGEDLVTLITCTPYAVNTHRLLVRGHRVPYVRQQNPLTAALEWLTPLRLAIIAVLLVALVSFVVVKRRRDRAVRKAVGRHGRRS